MDPRYLLFLLSGAIVGAISGWLVTRLLVRYALKSRWEQIAGQAAAFVIARLPGRDKILGRFTKPANYEKLMPVIEGHIDEFLRDRLKIAIPMIGMLIGERTIAQLKLVFMNELQSIFPEVLNSYVNDVSNEFDLETEIRKGVRNLDPAAIKGILLPFAGKNGLIIGLIAGVLTGLINSVILSFYV